MDRSRALIRDAGLAVALAAAGIAITGRSPVGGDRQFDGYGMALVAVAALVLIARRRWPLAVLAVSAVSVSTYLVLGYAYGPILISFFVAVYSAACYLPMRTSFPASVAALVVLLIHVVAHFGPGPGLVGLVPGSAWVVVPYAVGTTVRQSRSAAERARAELVRDRVADERLLVAQEVHDVVGHGLAAIKMQAEVALHVLAKKPEQAQTALIAISRTSTEALEELRSALALVRRDGDTRSPISGLGRLDGLKRRMNDAGVKVQVTSTGTPSTLSPSVDLVAYRVIQEALTNVLRHSEGKAATVEFAWQHDAVEISMTSRGGHRPADSDGHGIAGMRHRVESLGGTFSAGPTAKDQFEVRARLPIGERG